MDEKIIFQPIIMLIEDRELDKKHNINAVELIEIVHDTFDSQSRFEGPEMIQNYTESAPDKAYDFFLAIAKVKKLGKRFKTSNEKIAQINVDFYFAMATRNKQDYKEKTMKMAVTLIILEKKINEKHNITSSQLSNIVFDVNDKLKQLGCKSLTESYVYLLDIVERYPELKKYGLSSQKIYEIICDVGEIIEAWGK